MQLDAEKTVSHWLKETQKGYIRIAALILLSKRSIHGYEIMREIKERTMGFWKPTAGGVYPMLRNLEKTGYIEGQWNSQNKRKRKTYKITEAGKLVLERALTRESQIADSMRKLFKEFINDVLEIEMNETAIPRIPNFFSELVEERKEKPEDIIKVLRTRRIQIENMMGKLQKVLQTINKRLEKLEPSSRKQR